MDRMSKCSGGGTAASSLLKRPIAMAQVEHIRDAATRRDRDLVTRLLSGDTGAAEEFAAEFRRIAYPILRMYRIPASDIDDVFQMTFLTFWDRQCYRLRVWRAETTLRSYISTIVARVASAYYRQRGSRASRYVSLSCFESELKEQLDFVDPHVGPEDIVLSREVISTVNTALGQIAARDAELIRRRHYAGQSYKVIAEELGMTAGNVGVALGRAEERLRRHLMS